MDAQCPLDVLLNAESRDHHVLLILLLLSLNRLFLFHHPHQILSIQSVIGTRWVAPSMLAPWNMSMLQTFPQLLPVFASYTVPFHLLCLSLSLSALWCPDFCLGMLSSILYNLQTPLQLSFCWGLPIETIYWVGIGEWSSWCFFPYSLLVLNVSPPRGIFCSWPSWQPGPLSESWLLVLVTPFFFLILWSGVAMSQCYANFWVHWHLLLASLNLKKFWHQVIFKIQVLYLPFHSLISSSSLSLMDITLGKEGRLCSRSISSLCCFFTQKFYVHLSGSTVW